MTIKEDLKKGLKNELIQQNNQDSILQIKPANEWIDEAKKRPIPKKLFGELWFEGDLCIVFADTNLGKSILAVQIAHSISSGYPTCGLKLEADQQPVIYVDFELSDKQFECRYSDGYKNHFTFNDNFFRAEMEMGVQRPKKYKTDEDYLNDSLELLILQHSAKVLIIDNHYSIHAKQEIVINSYF